MLLVGLPFLYLLTSERGPFRALKMRPVRQGAVHSLWSRLFRAFEDVSRTPGSLFEHGTHIPYHRWPSPVPNARHRGRLPPQRSLANILADLIFFLEGGGVKIVYLPQLQFKLNNTNMRNNYITPTCEEIEINLDSTVLQSSVLPSGFEDGGEIWN